MQSLLLKDEAFTLYLPPLASSEHTDTPHSFLPASLYFPVFFTQLHPLHPSALFLEFLLTVFWAASLRLTFSLTSL